MHCIFDVSEVAWSEVFEQYQAKKPRSQRKEYLNMKSKIDRKLFLF